jgi:hypothetical protein
MLALGMAVFATMFGFTFASSWPLLYDWHRSKMRLRKVAALSFWPKKNQSAFAAAEAI